MSNSTAFNTACLKEFNGMKRGKTFWWSKALKPFGSGIISGKKNRDGCLLEIWNALQRRTGCVRIMKNAAEQKFVPPDLSKIKLGKKTIPSP